ncbi:hypothetical protein DVH24_042389 [Malus domestica]|uniref:Uncharacterized protein n=1 Tax=Malus domestica TaxID=3750 RepID=A0A498IYC2_MALDO|nr:hypothetical protein DVH24_042389 [Malus domestica]
MEDDDRGAIDEKSVDTLIGEDHRGEGFGNGRDDLDGLHIVDELGSEVDERVIYPEFNEEANMDDPNFEKGLKFKDVSQLREAL